MLEVTLSEWKDFVGLYNNNIGIELKLYSIARYGKTITFWIVVEDKLFRYHANAADTKEAFLWFPSISDEDMAKEYSDYADRSKAKVRIIDNRYNDGIKWAAENHFLKGEVERFTCPAEV